MSEGINLRHGRWRRKHGAGYGMRRTFLRLINSSIGEKGKRGRDAGGKEEEVGDEHFKYGEGEPEGGGWGSSSATQFKAYYAISGLAYRAEGPERRRLGISIVEKTRQTA